MGVASHVNVAHLLASPADDFDHRNATMVDGRAVQHTMMFIEPHLVTLHPAAVWQPSDLAQGEPFGSIAAGGFSPYKRARQSLPARADGSPSLHWIDGVIPVELLEIAGTTLRPAGADARTAFEEALSLLTEHGMAYFVELAVGAVIMGSTADASRFPKAPHCAVLDLSGTRFHLAQRLLRSAAPELIWQWIEVETFLNLGTLGRTPQRFDEMVDLFGDSVLCELLRRAEGSLDDDDRRRWRVLFEALAPRAPGMLAWLDTFATTPLTQELFSCWYPGWRRSLFIYNSPFDPMNMLKPLQPKAPDAAG